MNDETSDRRPGEGGYGFEPPVEEPNPDPFPKMIIVCAIISAVLFVVIVSFIIMDFNQRNDEAPVELPPPVIAVQ